MLAVDVDGVRFHLNTADKEISRIVFIYGLYDRPLMHAAFEGLRRLGGSAGFEGRLLLDVGANIGTTTLTACAHFGAGGAVAFEPDPTNLRFLGMNLSENDLGDRVRVHAAAVSNVAATLELERSSDNAGDHRVRAPGAQGRAGDVVAVAAVTIDDMIGSEALDPLEIGAVWLDVQGHEGHALAGARRLLETGPPIVVEYWPHGLRGAEGLELFDEVVASHYERLIDLGRPQDGPAGFDPQPISALGEIAERYGGPNDHTDLLLVPPSLNG